MKHIENAIVILDFSHGKACFILDTPSLSLRGLTKRKSSDNHGS